MKIDKLKILKEKMEEMPKIGFEGHWSSIKFKDNLLQDALIRHALGLTYYGMSDIGEIFEILCKIGNKNDDWINAWCYSAENIQKRAENAEKINKNETASTSYLRASTYWRMSLMYFNSIDDERIKKYSQNSMDCYEKYLKLSNYPGEFIEIPYGDSYLLGHFYRSPVAEENAPLLIITPGRDTWAEDTRWVYDTAIKRGIHCLVYDGPGQGLSLRLNNITFRHDIENVITPIIDFALNNFSGIDSNKISLMGLSFGGFLVPRAAAFDKRIKICITDPGNMNWGGAFINRFKIIQEIPKESRPLQLDFMLQDYVWKHGVNEKEIIEELEKYDNTSIIKDLSCLTIVLDGTSEINHGEAKKFYDALDCPKKYLLYDEESSAQMHCQMGGYATASELLFDLLEEYL